ncbi:MAG: hypothetical protein R3D98_08425 [Candidatus Krumholzibacteriia bacterium]
MFAAIDVGSHSTKLVLARRDPQGAWRRHLERVVVTGLGLGDPDRDGLDPAGRARTLAALAELARICRDHGVTDVVTAGTAVLRRARDAGDFVDQVRRETGLDLVVISGDEEARLTYLGAVGGLAPSDDEGVDLAFDVGGRSTELAWGRRDIPDDRRSLDLGTISLMNAYGLDGAVTPEVAAAAAGAVAAALDLLPPVPAVRRLVGIGATPGSLVAIREARDVADSLEVHGARLARDEIAGLCARLRGLDLAARTGLPGLHAGRAPVILAGGLITGAVADRWPAAPLIISATGLREGLLADRFGG